jgi:hypothetical protein
VTDGEGQQSRLEVEVQPVGTAFTGVATAMSGFAASGSVVQVTVSGLVEGAYHWQARSTDNQGASGAFASYDSNPEIDPDFRVELTNDAPASPTTLGQYSPPGTVGIALGGSPLGRTVIVRAAAVDPESRQLSIDIEVQPVGTAFTNPPTHTAAPTASGVLASITLAALADGSYHWQARARDDAAQASAWVSYGGNAETSTDFSITATTAVPPSAPIGVEQRTANGLATISTGASISQAAVRMRAVVVHPRTEIVKLQVEVKPTSAAFTGAADKESGFVASGSTAEVLIFGFPNDTYHWQARTVDSKGTPSAWVSYGANLESDSDFTVNVVANSPADVPIILGQFRADGVTLIATGGTTSQTTVVCEAFLTDPNADAVRLEVELKPVGVAFDGAVAATGAFYSNGTTVLLAIAGLADGRYHWRARATDSNGASSPWLSYGGNPESDGDFTVNALSNTAPAAASALDQLREGGTIAIAVGGQAGPGTLTFRADASDAEGDLVRLELEVRPAGDPFLSVSTHSGEFGPSGFAAEALTDRFPFGEGQHWQARVLDVNGATAGWIDFGANGSGADFTADFSIAPGDSNNRKCGSFGLDLLAPLAVLWMARRKKILRPRKGPRGEERA